MAQTDTMRRALAILKYVPAIMCGLLVVAWAVSQTRQLGFYYPRCHPTADPGLTLLLFRKGSVRLEIREGIPIDDWGFVWKQHDLFTCDLGELYHVHGNPYGPPNRNVWVWSLPIIFVLTILLPSAFIPLIRFPLWSYFAWTALVAAELAYYLRA